MPDKSRQFERSGNRKEKIAIKTGCVVSCAASVIGLLAVDAAH
jgi:hypothetical protein